VELNSVGSPGNGAATSPCAAAQTGEEEPTTGLYCWICAKLLNLTGEYGVSMSESDSDLSEARARKAEELRSRAESGVDSTPGRDEPVHVGGPDEFQSLLDEGGVVLVDFYADWCGPCKMLEPIVADLAAETDATVAKVDVDQQRQLATQYQVQGVPTMYLFADGEPVERMVGVKQKSELASLVEQYT
jgi:thioredoxin 1